MLAGLGTQGDQSIAIAYKAGHSSQAGSAVAISVEAGSATQGLHAVAIGNQCRFKTNQHTNTIILNATEV